MTTRQSLVLRKRSGAYLDLSSAPYEIGQNFTIPSIAPVSTISGGSSANIYGGGSLANLKYADRSWTFDVRVLSTTEAAVRMHARRIDSFLRSGSITDPVYIEYRPSTDTPEPLWGQYGVAFRYEVIFARTDLYDDYATAESRGLGAFVSVSATIKPFAITSQQRVCTATGGILEDNWGASDGLSRGLIIPEATTNKMTNPVFGHSTFGNGWTAGANLTATENTDPEYMLPGTAKSAKLQRTGATSTYTQSIDAGNTNKHSLGVIVKLHGGGTLATADVEVKYGASSVQVTPLSIGNGWYWLKYENFDGIASAQDVGVTVVTYNAVYVAAVQIEEKIYCTWPCWGDLPGCAWTSTAHDSTSTRTAATCKLPVAADTFNPAQFTVRIIWRAGRASSVYAGAVRLFYEAATNARLSIAASTGAFAFTDGTNTANGAATAFSDGQTIVIYASVGPSGIALYRNGVADGAGVGSYAPLTTATYWFIGSDSAGLAHTLGVYDDVALHDRALTASQVAADYANIAPLISAGSRVGSIPWFWTDDGDGILSLDTGKQPLGIVGGVPGSALAITEIQGTLSSIWTTIKTIAISNFSAEIPIKWSYLFSDQSGTVEAGTYGGQQRTTTVTGAADTLVTGGVSIPSIYSRYFTGKSYTTISRLKGSAADAISLYPSYTVVAATTGDARVITLSTGYRLFRTAEHQIDFQSAFVGKNSYTTVIKLIAYKATGTVDISVDYIAILPRPLLLATGNVGYKDFAIRGSDGYSGEEGTTLLINSLVCVGDKIEFEPNMYNHMQVYFGADETIDPAITYSATISAIYVTPRWALL